MFAIKTYRAALTLMFFVVAVTTRGSGVLEATVLVSLLLYMILDISRERQALRSQLARVSSLSVLS
jgi:hypothetical protein